MNSSVTHPREVMIPTIKEPATYFALIHFYSSGDPISGQKGFKIILRLIKTGKIIGRNMVGNIIIRGKTVFSVLLTKD